MTDSGGEKTTMTFQSTKLSQSAAAVNGIQKVLDGKFEAVPVEKYGFNFSNEYKLNIVIDNSVNTQALWQSDLQDIKNSITPSIKLQGVIEFLLP